jgi:hypothetical protein
MLYSIQEAARMLGGISPWTLRKHISPGQKVRVVRLGRRVFLDAEELERIRREGLPSLRGVPAEKPEGEQVAKSREEAVCLTK